MKEFREQVVKLVLVDGLSRREVAGKLSWSVKTREEGAGSWLSAKGGWRR